MRWRVEKSDVLGWNLSIKVYDGPDSSSGVERQQKTGKWVHTARRNQTGGGKVKHQVSVAYNATLAVHMMVVGRQKFEYVIVIICSNDDLESEVAAERDVDLLTLMENEISDEYAGQKQVGVDPVSLLLTEMDITEQDILERLLPVGDGTEDITDHILFVSHDNK